MVDVTFFLYFLSLKHLKNVKNKCSIANRKLNNSHIIIKLHIHKYNIFLMRKIKILKHMFHQNHVIFVNN